MTLPTNATNGATTKEISYLKQFFINHNAPFWLARPGVDYLVPPPHAPRYAILQGQDGGDKNAIVANAV
ncbi:hypothetical protein HS069_09830 [Mannheimia haemolytica]